MVVQEPSPKLFITMDRSSHRVHERIRYKDRWFVDERCQTDQSGSFDIIEDVSNLDRDQFCGFCFPRVL